MSGHWKKSESCLRRHKCGLALAAPPLKNKKQTTNNNNNMTAHRSLRITVNQRKILQRSGGFILWQHYVIPFVPFLFRTDFISVTHLRKTNLSSPPDYQNARQRRLKIGSEADKNDL